MNNQEFQLKTPFGTITVVAINDEEFPGVRVDIGHEQIARIEFNKLDDTLDSFLWYKGDDEPAHKISQDIPLYRDSVQLEDAHWDIESALENLEQSSTTGEIAELSDEDRLEIMHQIRKFDYSSYNEYVQDLVDEKAKLKESGE